MDAYGCTAPWASTISCFSTSCSCNLSCSQFEVKYLYIVPYFCRIFSYLFYVRLETLWRKQHHESKSMSLLLPKSQPPADPKHPSTIQMIEAADKSWPGHSDIWELLTKGLEVAQIALRSHLMFIDVRDVLDHGLVEISHCERLNRYFIQSDIYFNSP